MNTRAAREIPVRPALAIVLVCALLQVPVVARGQDIPPAATPAEQTTAVASPDVRVLETPDVITDEALARLALELQKAQASGTTLLVHVTGGERIKASPETMAHFADAARGGGLAALITRG